MPLNYTFEIVTMTIHLMCILLQLKISVTQCQGAQSRCFIKCLLLSSGIQRHRSLPLCIALCRDTALGHLLDVETEARACWGLVLQPQMG